MPAIVAQPPATRGDQLRLRIARLGQLLQRVAPVPEEWLVEGAAERKSADRITPVPCDSWVTLERAWVNSGQRWRRGMSDLLTTMLAVAASTSQTGNQLNLLVIASASSGKTTFCDAMLTSGRCRVVEKITGFTSGARSDDGRDLSFLARANHQTWITPEGDVMVASPQFQELMADGRRIFDGSFNQVFKTTDDDLSFTGLRTPWIIAGTPFMIDYWEQSRLGDRFLRHWLDDPVDNERRKITLAAMDSEWQAVTEHSNGSSGGIESRLRNAYATTGGYVEWLRANVGRIDRISISEDDKERVADYAEFVADMRARPNSDPKKVDCHDTKELPARLGRQLIRLARCYALVLNKVRVDWEVMRLVRDRALDTARGRTCDLLKWFMAVDPRTAATYQSDGGLMTSTLTRWANWDSEPKLLQYLGFLSKIGVVEHVTEDHSHGSWRLTDRVDRIYRAVYGVNDP